MQNLVIRFAGRRQSCPGRLVAASLWRDIHDLLKLSLGYLSLGHSQLSIDSSMVPMLQAP